MNFNEISRERLTEMAQANDPNGIWLDDRSISEGMPIATKEYLMETFVRWAEEEGITVEELINQFI
jgi:hypothetical protein